MCGLVAMHTVEKNGFYFADKEEFKQMMVLNSIRGVHSTGIAGFNMRANEPKVSLIKSINSPYYLYNYTQSDVFFDRFVKEFTTVIGHGRYATKGEVNAINAHPFEEGHITLAHNGVINNFHSLQESHHSKIEVDSHLVAKLFEEKEAIDVLPTIEGAYVFIWFDSRTKTLNIARNSQRPLFVAELSHRNTLIFASEETTLEWNAKRNKTHIKGVEEIKPYQIYTYTADSLIPTITPYKQYFKPYVHPNQHPYDYDNKWKSKAASWKPRATILDSQERDKKLLGKVKQSSNIESGGTISYEIDDYSTQNGYIVVWGYNKNYPDVLFKSSLMNTPETVLYDVDFAQGYVTSILPHLDKQDDYKWIVFIGDAKLCKDNPDFVHRDDEDRLKITNVEGYEETITWFRLKQLAATGCSWCRGLIRSQELEHPETLLLQSSNGFEDEVVCPDCANYVLNNLEIFNVH